MVSLAHFKGNASLFSLLLLILTRFSFLNGRHISSSSSGLLRRDKIFRQFQALHEHTSTQMPLNSEGFCFGDDGFTGQRSPLTSTNPTSSSFLLHALDISKLSSQHSISKAAAHLRTLIRKCRNIEDMRNFFQHVHP